MVRVTTPFNPRTFLHREYPEWPVALPNASWGDDFKRFGINLTDVPDFYSVINDGANGALTQESNLRPRFTPNPNASNWKTRVLVNPLAWEFSNFPPDFPLPYEWQLDLEGLVLPTGTNNTYRVSMVEPAIVNNFQSTNIFQFNFDPGVDGWTLRSRVKIADSPVYNEVIGPVVGAQGINLQMIIRRNNTVTFEAKQGSTNLVRRTTPPLSTLSPNRRFLVIDIEGSGTTVNNFITFSSIEWAYR